MISGLHNHHSNEGNFENVCELFEINVMRKVMMASNARILFKMVFVKSSETVTEPRMMVAYPRKILYT